ncbi:hypothetical protein FEP92_05702 [Burkholderia multivorans]|nr:hypothetical protein [Burkholderia multivorans]
MQRLVRIETDTGLLYQQRFFGARGSQALPHVVEFARRRVLRQRDARARGVEQADRLVRQLTGRNVTLRQRYCRADRFVPHDDAVMRRKRRREAAHHVGRRRFGRLRDLQHLKAPRQRGILLDMPLVFGPGRRADGADRAARERRFQEVCGVAGAGLSTRADQRMDFVDEQDDGGGRACCGLEDVLQAGLELPLHAGARQQRADIEAQQFDVGQIRRHVARGDRMRQPLHHRGLADTGLTGDQRIVLPPTQQHVDHGADFQFAADNGIDFAGACSRGEIEAIPLERVALRRVRHGTGGLARQRRRQLAAIVRLVRRLRRPVDPRGKHVAKIGRRDLAELGGNGEEHAPQFGGRDQRCDQPCAAHATIAMAEGRQHPAALDGRFDVPGKIADRTRAGRQRSQRPRQVALERIAIDIRMAHDPLQVAVRLLEQLVQPVDEFDERVPAQLAETRRRFDSPVELDPELAEQGLA